MPSLETSWILSLPIYLYAAILLGSCVLAMLLAKVTAHFSLVGVLRKKIWHARLEIECLRSEKNPLWDENSQKSRIALLEDLSNVARHRLQTRNENARARLLRHAFHALTLFTGFLVALFTSASLAQYICLAGLLTILWYAAAVDIDHFQVPEILLLVLGTVLSWASLSRSDASWTTPEGCLLGLALCVTTIGIAWLVVRARKGAGLVIFGDGDVITLIVLSLYFGVDVLIILAIACVCFIAMHLLARPLNMALKTLGHYPESEESAHVHMPFLPAIYFGTIMMLIVQTLFSFRSLVESVYATSFLL